MAKKKVNTKKKAERIISTMPPNMELKLFAGNSNPELSSRIAKKLGVPLGETDLKTFSDGEIFVKIHENVRGDDVFIVQSLTPRPNHYLMELLIMIDACRRASARRITAVIPYYCYGRQDRKDQPRVAITAKLLANLLVTAGANRVLSMDLHVGQIQGFFDIPMDHLFAAPVLLKVVKKLKLKDFTVVSPDTGSLKRSRAYAKQLDAPLAFIDKRRPKPNVAEVMNIIGEIKGRDCIIIDDMIDTAGTLTMAAEALKMQGAKDIYACATHPVMSGPAIERLTKSCFKKIIVTDTVPLGDKICDKIEVVSVGGLLAECIHRIHEETTVSTLFLKTNYQT
jgi:ribose-phosphate pyrophosphokinase